jgi:hypothetical protein
MPVDGLPNPTLHRLCRRCGKWHHLHEGSYVMPSSSGPVSWLISGYQRQVDPQALLRFVCSACQAPAGPSRRQRLLASLAVLIASVLMAWLVWWLHDLPLFDSLFGPLGR